MLLICLLEQAEFLEKSYAEHPNSGKDNWESDSSSVTNSSESESESESEMQHDDQEQEFRRKLELKKAESVRMRLKSYQLGKKGTLDASKFRRNIDRVLQRDVALLSQSQTVRENRADSSRK